MPSSGTIGTNHPGHALGLTNEEVSALVAFLKALTDPGSALDPALLVVPESVPSGLEPVFGAVALNV